MANASFTRDEIILALDVLYSKTDGKLKADSPEMQDLSALLNRLPIHPRTSRRPDFRTAPGITHQLGRFQRSMQMGEKHEDIGKAFIDVAIEFEDRLEQIHNIANAIRRNEPFFATEFGGALEDVHFPEGILLGHLHRVIEQSTSYHDDGTSHCAICKIQPTVYYKTTAGLLQLHLLVPPEKMDGKKKYGAGDFITVCPTCHAALHRFRPWCSRDNCEELLR